MKKPLDKKAFVIATLRKASYRWPTRNAAIRRAKVKVQVGFYKNGKPKTKLMSFCEKCGLITEETVKDHQPPVIDPKKGFTGWNDYVERMFPDTEWGYQILCKPCDKLKTGLELKKRAKVKKKLAKASK
jgi:hypothetical protein